MMMFAVLNRVEFFFSYRQQWRFLIQLQFILFICSHASQAVNYSIQTQLLHRHVLAIFCPSTR